MVEDGSSRNAKLIGQLFLGKTQPFAFLTKAQAKARDE